MMLKSFGCSFIFGTDLPDEGRPGMYAGPSQLTWPALIAKKTNLDYGCYACPGSGNLRILESVLSHAASGKKENLFVIGWTWIDRFDYTTTQDEWKTILPVDETALAKTYYKDLHSQYRDKLTTLLQIRNAIDVLNQYQIPFIMTYMDDLIFESEWHATSAVIGLQEYIRPYMTTFEGNTFLDWARTKNYEISPTLHPLETAHAAAAEFMLKQIQKTL
jgi:hypothetical protein